jgi:hypothetical protein
VGRAHSLVKHRGWGVSLTAKSAGPTAESRSLAMIEDQISMALKLESARE